MDQNVFLPIPPDVSTDNRNLYGGRKTGLLHLHDLQKDLSERKRNGRNDVGGFAGGWAAGP